MQFQHALINYWHNDLQDEGQPRIAFTCFFVGLVECLAHDNSRVHAPHYHRELHQGHDQVHVNQWELGVYVTQCVA